MIQITGLTKVYRRGGAPAVLDLTFDARPGVVTALLGPEDSGKSTALRLMLELERGQGVTLFDGRTYRRLRRPEREVGVLLADPAGASGAAAGHPGRKAHSHLRMLAAAVGLPGRRADELLEQTRLATVAGQRLRTFSPGMHRRLALATALLGDPGTLLLDAPTEGLSPRNVEWFHSFLRSFGVAGGTVLVTTRSPQEAAQLADRVLTLDQGRLVADQPVTEFCRTRLSPEVAVRGPQMARLADLLIGQGAEVRRDGGAGLAVAGIGRTEIGELAYRHGILLHELADRVVEQPAPRATLPAASGRSGHIQLQPPKAGPAKPQSAKPEPTKPQPARTPATRSRSEEAQAEPRTAKTPAAQVPQPAAADPDEGVLPALALPVTAAAGSGSSAVTSTVPTSTVSTSKVSAATALSAATARSARTADRTPAPVAAAEATGTLDALEDSPTVAVDRLFRDSRTAVTRQSDPVPASTPGPRDQRTGSSAADLLTDDTVRLGRFDPLAARTAATPRPTPDRPATDHPTADHQTPDHQTPDHRSE
ncbi:ATP-binding cassette domain-containing protein [Kitasatospora sp. NPDC052868]|uniref:ATP-binding cassette domain-containing protein n=1 Tax=Kitasatospora sp. NPDC052868 TaxID=3364060 RepID=UPI0037C8D282